jgi:cob(I)alamin adenosyltransferase
VAKTGSRIEAFSTVEEAAAALGLALAFGDLAEDLAAVVRDVQNDRFVVRSLVGIAGYEDCPSRWNVPPAKVQVSGVDRSKRSSSSSEPRVSARGTDSRHTSAVSALTGSRR